MPVWALWTTAAAVLATGELLTPGLFFLGPLALAALAAAIIAAALGTLASFIAFVVAAAVCVAVLRPLARRHIRLPALNRTGAAALVGERALVLKKVDRSDGRVKIGGEEWSARLFLDGEPIEPGEQVEVVQIDGATALVLH